MNGDYRRSLIFRFIGGTLYLQCLYWSAKKHIFARDGKKKTASVRRFQAQAYDVNSTIQHAACAWFPISDLQYSQVYISYLSWTLPINELELDSQVTANHL